MFKVVFALFLMGQPIGSINSANTFTQAECLSIIGDPDEIADVQQHMEELIGDGVEVHASCVPA